MWVSVSISVCILNSIDASHVVQRVDKQTIIEAKGLANCVFDASQMKLVLLHSVSETLHMHGIALISGALVQSGSAHDPFGQLTIRSGHLLNVVQSGFPSSDDVEHQ